METRVEKSDVIGDVIRDIVKPTDATNSGVGKVSLWLVGSSGL